MDDFDKLMAEIEKLHILTGSAIELLPSVLKKETKHSLLKYSPQEAAGIMLEAIREIEHGSLDSTDTAVMKQLKKNR